MRFDIHPSPTPTILINRFDKFKLPAFGKIFDIPSPSSPLFHLARPPQEAAVAVVFENRADKALTALALSLAADGLVGEPTPRYLV